MPLRLAVGMVGLLMVLVLLARGAGFIRGMIRNSRWCLLRTRFGLLVFSLASALC
ncbi:hypothetical protein SAMN04487926_10915 [Paraburkholderia steynii]|uniref:Uncharacterized protein n=1 Tax=Paraburkholderia steynii TaxID=1245441 RepID=A0A7Z7BA14_9BURK|nr:hypothetical protein SAMN04487926_10915 [Paraburkholderia steynii]